MNFDMSKENVQPLRGGRNVSQLEVALQAQNNHEYQRELLQQKEEFENAIRNYEGDDPLENWYNYISWIEQSYPKHGHEGNLLILLEKCTKIFEDDKRYMNDRRLCRIWIKYIDYQQNPLEIYHMLFAKGICRGVADMYKAWAYYYEVSGDFKNADVVFQRGERELAQPFEDLMIAHRNMIYAAGQQVIKGVDQNRLEEQRLALTCLKTYKHGKVGSVRTPGSSSAGMLGVKVPSKYNSSVLIYEDPAESIAGAEAAPSSILTIAQRQDGPKENIIKAGPWATMQNISREPVVHRVPPFTIHDDSNDIHSRGLILPEDFFRVTHEDFSSFKPSLIYPEPADPKKISKYPKSLVYAEENIEYSIEEIKARQYLMRSNNCSNVSQCETQQAVQSILDERATGAIHRTLYKLPQTVVCTRLHMSPQFHVEYHQINEPMPNYDQRVNSQCDQEDLKSQVQPSHFSNSKENNCWSFQNQQSLLKKTSICQPFAFPSHDSYESPITMDAIWRSPNESLVQPRGCAMSSHDKILNGVPLKILSDDDLAETGSRGGLDVAAAAQPADGAIINLDEDTNSSYGEALPYHTDQSFGLSTQTFNFNLNAMKVSTPVQERHYASVSNIEVGSTKKNLFLEQKALSTIFEETKNYGLTSSSGSLLGMHSRKINHINLTPEENSYSSNLAQNLKANEALRSSLLGEYMECQSQQSSPIAEIPPSIPAVKPTLIIPLLKAPSDPFQGSLIKTLLERINFPGQHTHGYTKIFSVPRLNVKKEVVEIGTHRYLVEKMLGKGTYGSVFKAVNWQTREIVALKFQKPPNKWEFYICRELQARLADHPLKEKFMDVSIGYFNEQASILVSDFSPNGSLLDVANAIKQKSGRTMKEILCVYFCIEMLEIVDAMHQAKIIHADVKPDNFLVQLFDNNVTLQLIDFGCSIDMAMFPKDTTFNRRVRTEDFVCCEMHDGRPWSYHTDLFCVAATAHVLLFDKYIQMQKKDGHWSITQRFTRYWRVDCWNQFFSNLLNQQTGPALVEPLVAMLRSVLSMNLDEYNTEMRFLVNLLKGR